MRPFIDQTIGSVSDALRDAELPAELNAGLKNAGLDVDMNDILVLMGGSTCIPFVMQRLREEFALNPSFVVDPDLAVALAVATRAGMLLSM